MALKNFCKWIGLFIALVIPVINSLYILYRSYPNHQPSLIGQVILWLPLVLLLLVLKFGEKENYSSLGSMRINFKTIGLIGLIAVALFGASFLLGLVWYYILKLPIPDEVAWQRFLSYPVWVKIEICLWAGIVLETFYRGYGITRLEQLTGSRAIAFTIPLVLFAMESVLFGTLYHVVFAFVCGFVLTAFYFRWRNLVVNIAGNILFNLVAILCFN